MIGPFEELLSALGRVFHLELQVDKSGACSILIPPELVVQLQLDSSQENLFLFCKILEVPPGKFRENVLLEALKANAQPDPVPGILAYLHATSHLILYQSYPLAILNGERLGFLFSNFLQMADSWKKSLEGGRSSPHPTSPPRPSEKPFGIRP